MRSISPLRLAVAELPPALPPASIALDPETAALYVAAESPSPHGVHVDILQVIGGNVQVIFPPPPPPQPLTHAAHRLLLLPRTRTVQQARVCTRDALPPLPPRRTLPRHSSRRRRHCYAGTPRPRRISRSCTSWLSQLAQR